MWQNCTLDFLQLQCIDYHAAFWCIHGTKYLTGDGITLGFHIWRSLFWTPWAAVPGSEPVRGSKPTARYLVPTAALRKLLYRFAKEGLPDAELADLRQGVHNSATAGSLLPFLQCEPGGWAQCRVPPKAWRPVLESLGTTAPECVLLPTVVHDVITTFADGGSLSLADLTLLGRNAPLMSKFLRPVFSGGAEPGLISNLRTLCRSLLQVSTV